MTRYGFVPPTAGTCERGSAERGRQETMIEAAGGVLEYMRGVRPRNRVDGDVLNVLQYEQPRDTSGEKMSA